MLRPAIILALALSLAPAAAEPRLVSDPRICDLPPDAGPGELGAILTPSFVEEIEYLCEFDPPVNYTALGDKVEVRLGYCSEPGLLTPELFAFTAYDGTIEVHQRGWDTPRSFRPCP